MRVKMPGIPAPPARNLSAMVPCGDNSRATSPPRYASCRRLLVPTYDMIILEICLVFIKGAVRASFSERVPIPLSIEG